MSKEEIINKIEELEEMLYEIDEEQEKLVEFKKQARFSAKALKIMIEEYEKEGFDKNFSIELIKLSIGDNKWK